MLHHYTTVSTLALILRHQTLRFTRLDQFDDVSEGRSIGHFPLGARTFASCWSAAREESIPQWAMYGDGMKGIRLSLRPDPFIWHPIDIRWHENFQFIDLQAPYSLEEMLASNITLTPTPEMKAMFGQRVRYVPDVQAAIEHLYSNPTPDELTLFGEGTEIAYFKPSAWAFQEEYRFVLAASPGPETPYQGDSAAYIRARGDWHRTGVNIVRDIPNRTHVDIRLDSEALRSAEILVGPLAPAGTFEIVESLVSKFAKGARIKMSSLSNTIRPR